jgi:hypothetical protein
MDLNLERVRANVQAATTEDLLDRATVYREGMEPAALDLIEQELFRRGLTARDLTLYEEQRQGKLLVDRQGVALRCARCERPATWAGWRWHRLWGRVPLFPRWTRLCDVHRQA